MSNAPVSTKTATLQRKARRAFVNARWAVPVAMPNADWMVAQDVTKLTTVLASIEAARLRNPLVPEQHERLLAQLLQRSPKKTGILFEVVERHMHQLGKGRDVSHDAVCGTERIEIKGSRVITQRNAEAATNLYECLLEEERFFAPVREALMCSYDCNIQQVKCRSFDRILYCLYFADAIVEFEMTSTQLQGFIDDKVTGVCPHVTRAMASDAQGTTHGAAARVIAEKMQLAYSDFQHAGNEGEGQFHIKASNILYHLVRHCTRVYSYSEFAQVLKAQPLA